MADPAFNESNLITAPPELLVPAFADLLRRISDTWQTYRPDDLTEAQSQALYLLIGTGLVEGRGRLQVSGRTFRLISNDLPPAERAREPAGIPARICDVFWPQLGADWC